MRLLLRLALAGVTAAALAACLAAALDGGTPDPRGRRPESGLVAPVGEEGLRLECRRVATLARIEAKQEVAGGVVEGRLSLLEAAAAFRSIHAACPEAARLSVRYTSGQREEEMLCRNVIGYVRNSERCTPAAAAALADRLEAELQQLLARGPIRLRTPVDVP